MAIHRIHRPNDIIILVVGEDLIVSLCKPCNSDCVPCRKFPVSPVVFCLGKVFDQLLLELLCVAWRYEVCIDNHLEFPDRGVIHYDPRF